MVADGRGECEHRGAAAWNYSSFLHHSTDLEFYLVVRNEFYMPSFLFSSSSS